MSDQRSPLQVAYQRLLDLHTEALLKHGAGVAQGVALAVKAVLNLMPADERQVALEQWAEGVPDELIGAQPTDK